MVLTLGRPICGAEAGIGGGEDVMETVDWLQVFCELERLLGPIGDEM